MRSGWERDALFLGFEAGPFGYGHQHEDKLGVVIFAYGKDLLVDGGSYAYDASIMFLKKEALFLVRDTLESLDAKSHLYEALWHLDVNAVDLDVEKGIVETRDAGANLRIVPFCDKSLKARVVKGQETPTVQGWMPLGHGIRGVRPIPTIVYECQAAEPVVCVTVFQPLHDGKEDRIEHVSSVAGQIRIAYASGRTTQTALPPRG